MNLPHIIRRLGLALALLLGAALAAAEPTVGANGWTNRPGVMEGTVTTRPVDTTVPKPPLGYVEYLPKGYNPADANTRWPLVVFISGQGEIGDGTDTAANGHQLTVCMTRYGPLYQITGQHWDFPAVVVGVQQAGLWNNANVLQSVIEYMQARYHLDPDRIYLTGLCDGAVGLYNFASQHPGLLAAIMPIEAGADPEPGAASYVKDLPTWAVHCFSDPLIARTSSIAWIDQATQADIGASDVMSTYPGYAGVPYHAAVDVNANGQPVNPNGPFTSLPGSTLTNGSTWVAFGPSITLGSAIFNSWGGTDQQPYAQVGTATGALGAAGVVAVGKSNGLYLTQPYAGATGTLDLMVKIPIGYNATAYLDPASALWVWQRGQAWDHSRPDKRIFTMCWYQDHTGGWTDTYANGDCWDWLFTQTKSIAPVISSPTTASVAAGAAFSYVITASGGPTAFAASGLPAGLTVNAANGAISGSSSAVGTTTVTLSAANAAGTGTAALTLTIAPPPPVITSATSATAIANTPFSYQIAAGNAPTAYGADGLPPGLQVDPGTGAITGTTTAAGSAAVLLSATNGSGTGSATLNLTLVGPPTAPAITSPGNAAATVGAGFSFQVTANAPATFSASGLPAGLVIDAASGLITGTPGAAGTQAATLVATGAGGTQGTATLTVTVAPAAPVITSAGSAGASVGTPFLYRITATNAPTSFAASGLPAWLSLDAGSGVLSGTPTTSGSVALTLAAANAGGTGTAPLALTVAPAAIPVITSPAAATTVVGQTFAYQITATNGPTSFAASGLPATMTVDPVTGAITGTTTAAMQATVTLWAGNQAGAGSMLLTLTALPGITPVTKGTGAVTARGSSVSGGCGLGSAVALTLAALGMLRRGRRARAG